MPAKAQVQPQVQPKKKGSAVWKPADRLGVIDNNPDYRYKWCDRSPEKLEKHHQEGWVPVNKTTGIPGDHREGDHATDGVDITGARSHRELILHALPREQAEARAKYYQELTDQQTSGLKRQLERDVASGSARIHGDIEIK